jgi:hypothetical protein
MLRTLVVVLLLANAAVLAWNLGALDGPLGRRPNAEREPERLQRQVNPDLVKLLPPAGASAPAASSSPVTAASSPVMPVAATATATATATAAALCLEAGPLPAAALPGAEKALLAAGVRAGSWSTAAAERKGVFLIYMGRYEDDDTLQRKLEELKRRRIEAQPVRQADLQPGIEVGRFDDKETAEATLARLSQRGLRTARVLTLVPPQPQLMLRLAAAEPGQAAALATLQLTPNVSGFSRCAAAAEPAPPAARAIPASASAATAAAALPAALGSAARPAASRPRAAASGAASPAARGGSGAASTTAAPASPAARGASPGSAAP